MSARVRLAADVEPAAVRWLWPGYVPLGKLAFLDGDPGLGKSLITLDLAARVTRGRPMPDGGRSDLTGPASVIILAAEDDAGDTIVPRLVAAGADLSRVVLWEAVPDANGGDTLPEFPTDAGLLLHLILEHRAALVVVDPVMAHLADHVDTRSDQQVRRALLPLKEAAEQTDAAVLCVRHLNKTPGGNPLYRGGGSIAFIGLARAGLMVGPDPDDETRHVLASTKSNLGPRPASLAYRVVADADGVPSIRWEGTVSLTARDLLRQEREPSPERQQVLAYVKGAGRPVGPKDVADALGIAEHNTRYHLSRAVKDGQLARHGTGLYMPLTQTHTHNPHNTHSLESNNIKVVSAVSDVSVSLASKDTHSASHTPQTANFANFTNRVDIDRLNVVGEVGEVGVGVVSEASEPTHTRCSDCGRQIIGAVNETGLCGDCKKRRLGL